MSVASSLIADWIEKKLPWQYIYAPKLAAFTLAAGQMFQIPVEEFAYKYPEGTLIHAYAAFDHPMCGMRLEAQPDLDTEDTITINSLLVGGVTAPNPNLYVIVPPTSPFYGLTVVKEWQWVDWIRLYVFNSDTAPHNCYLVVYTLAVLSKPRPLKAVDLSFWLSLDPRLREPMLKKYGPQIRELLEEQKVSLKGVE